jgi:hypothetical protein
MKLQELTLCKLKLKKCSIGMPLYQEEYHMDCQQSLNAHIA